MKLLIAKLFLVCVGLLALPAFADEDDTTRKAPGAVVIPPFPKLESKNPLVAPLAPEPLFNVMVGANLIYPAVGFQYTMGDMGTVGLLAHTYRVSVHGHESTLAGGLVTFGGYSERAFEGIWVQLGAGAYASTSTYAGVTSKTMAWGALGTVGYRFRFDGWNLGVAGGAMYFDIAKTTAVPRASVLWPTGLFDVGFAF